jgi:hypothetical protein
LRLGRTWTAVETPIAAGNASSGVFSIARDDQRILAGGGDYKDPGRPFHAAAYSVDGGKSWRLASQPPGGYRSSVAWVYGDSRLWVAVGPNGEDLSGDYGLHWKHTDSLNLNAAALLDIGTGWAVGPNGTIARFLNH